MNLADHLVTSLTSDMFDLIRLVKADAERLEVPLYIIGGSVRDLLLKSSIKDFDLTVEGDAIALARSLAKKHGAVTVDAACATALEVKACEYRFVRRYLERQPAVPLTLRQVDPMIRQLTLYRDLIADKTQENPS